MLQWAREHDCPWGETCNLAAKGGQLEVLKWAQARNCPLGEMMFTYAAEAGEILRTSTRPTLSPLQRLHASLRAFTLKIGCPGPTLNLLLLLHVSV